MTETESGVPGPPPAGPPARGPGPVPDGYVPREWVETHHAHLQRQGAPPSSEAPWPGLAAVPGGPASAGPYPPVPQVPAVSMSIPHPGMTQPVPGVMPPPPPPPAGAVWTAQAAYGAGPPPAATDSSFGTPFLETPWVPPQTKRQAWFWILFALLGFIAGQIGAVLFTYVGAVLEGKTTQLSTLATATVPPEWYVVSSLLGLWLGFIGAPWLASFAQGTRHFFADLGIRMKWIDLIGIPIGFAGQLLVVLMYAPFQHDIHDFNGPTNRLTGGSHGGGFVVIALATIIFAPAMEELFFRGLLLKGLVRAFTPLAGSRRLRVLMLVVAIVTDGLLFGLAHGEWIQLAGLAAFGMVLAFISYRTGRLGMNFLAHATFNGVAIVALVANGSALIH